MNPVTAMAAEGGKGAHRVCIPSFQNEGAQGELFRDFVRKCDPPKDGKFMIRMKGGCNVRAKRVDKDSLQDTNSNTDILLPRQDSSPSSFSASSNTLHQFSNLSYVYVALEELRNGHYSIDLSLQGDVQRVMVLDSDGEEYYASTDGGKGSSIEFDIDGVDPGNPLPAGLFVDTQKAVILVTRRLLIGLLRLVMPLLLLLLVRVGLKRRVLLGMGVAG